MSYFLKYSFKQYIWQNKSFSLMPIPCTCKQILHARTPKPGIDKLMFNSPPQLSMPPELQSEGLFVPCIWPQQVRMIWDRENQSRLTSTLALEAAFLAVSAARLISAAMFEGRSSSMRMRFGITGERARATCRQSLPFQHLFLRFNGSSC